MQSGGFFRDTSIFTTFLQSCVVTLAARWTHVQSTARVWRSCRCLLSAPAPTGQDAVNWQTWWGRRPHGRAGKQKIKSSVNGSYCSLWNSGFSSCWASSLISSKLNYEVQNQQNQERLSTQGTKVSIPLALSLCSCTVTSDCCLAKQQSTNNLPTFVITKSIKAMQVRPGQREETSSKPSWSTWLLSELYLKVPSVYGVHTRAGNHANDCCCQQGVFWKTYILLRAAHFLLRIINSSTHIKARDINLIKY